MADGGASSPATTTPTGFHLKPAVSGREIRKETVFLPENGIFLQKNRCGRAVHAATTDWNCRSIEVFGSKPPVLICTQFSGHRHLN